MGELPCGTFVLPAEDLQEVPFMGDPAACSLRMPPVPCPASEVTWWTRLEQVPEAICTGLCWASPLPTPNFSACLAPNSERLWWVLCGNPGLSDVGG